VKISEEKYVDAIRAAMRSVAAGEAALPRYRNVVSAVLAELGIEVERAPAPDEFIWVARTWVDVREGDIVRPVQPPSRRDDEQHAAIVTEIGPVNHWHAAPNASQYRPNESPLEWSARRVTMESLDGGRTLTPEHGMKPDAGVDIKVTRAELAAIEACGGWSERVGVC